MNNQFQILSDISCFVGKIRLQKEVLILINNNSPMKSRFYDFHWTNKSLRMRKEVIKLGFTETKIFKLST